MPGDVDRAVPHNPARDAEQWDSGNMVPGGNDFIAEMKAAREDRIARGECRAIAQARGMDPFTIYRSWCDVHGYTSEHVYRGDGAREAAWAEARAHEEGANGAQMAAT